MSDDAHAALVEAIATTGSEVVSDLLESVLISLRTGKRIDELPQPVAQQRVHDLIVAWERHPNPPSKEAVALALEAAACTAMRQSESTERVQLVWTGPEDALNSTRRTERVLLELIECAQKSLLIVSYAVYDVPGVVDAIDHAMGRGVDTTLVLDLPSPAEGDAWNNVAALHWPPEHRRPRLLYWPDTTRAHASGEYVPKLHVKCVVADARELLVTSANLTSHALEHNMELGLRVAGGSTARSLAQHFGRLEQLGILRTWPPSE